MPSVKPGESSNDFVKRCIPVVMVDGTAKDQDQAVAVCSQMYRVPGKSIVMKMTKVETLQNGRIRWRARANTGEFDLLQERFDRAFFDDVVANFYRVQEALSKGQLPPDGMTEPILDISHYSIYLPPEKRNLARGGWPNKMWCDGRALFAQGYFDNTRLGHLAAKAALDRPPEDRRVSIVVYPDYNNVLVEAGGERITYRGGNGKAWMDSLAMTSSPADPGATMEVRSMTTIRDDAEKVLGAEGADVIAELEAARTAKALPDGAVIKAEGDAELTIEEAGEEITTEAQPLTADDLAAALGEIMPALGDAIDQRLTPLAEQVADLATKADHAAAQIKALGATEVEKVQKAIQGTSLFETMWPNEKQLSVQRSGATETAKGSVKSPEETQPKPGDVRGAYFDK